MSRIAVISDIHGNILALEAVAEDIKKRSISNVVNLGDHISGPLWPKETIVFLMQMDWVHIRGNHDRQLIKDNPEDHCHSDKFAFQFLEEKELAWLNSLPPQQIPGKGIVAVHGRPGADTEYLLETIENRRLRLASHREIFQRLNNASFNIMLCGHSHIQRVVTLSGGRTIINPGSVGLPAYKDDSAKPHISEMGSPHARYSILELSGNELCIENIVISYDYEIAALKAEQNNRPDWAVALRTGIMDGVL